MSVLVLSFLMFHALFIATVFLFIAAFEHVSDCEHLSSWEGAEDVLCS